MCRRQWRLNPGKPVNKTKLPIQQNSPFCCFKGRRVSQSSLLLAATFIFEALSYQLNHCAESDPIARRLRLCQAVPLTLSFRILSVVPPPHCTVMFDLPNKITWYNIVLSDARTYPRQILISRINTNSQIITILVAHTAFSEVV